MTFPPSSADAVTEMNICGDVPSAQSVRQLCEEPLHRQDCVAVRVAPEGALFQAWVPWVCAVVIFVPPFIAYCMVARIAVCIAPTPTAMLVTSATVITIVRSIGTINPNSIAD